jgi:hypothetical protein
LYFHTVWDYRQYSAIAILHTLQSIVAHIHTHTHTHTHIRVLSLH